MKYKQNNKIKTIVEKMLKENTGVHFLDSGGAYGRYWQDNQKVDFNKMPELNIEVDKDYVNITLNVYHYLTSFLEITKDSFKLNNKFQEFMNLPENKDTPYLALMEEFAKRYESRGTNNTYNYDNILNQTLQYTMFLYKDKPFIILQIHGGCDVRGGYTEPTIFEVMEEDYFRMAQSDINATDGENDWMSDDSGYNWYYDGSSEDKKPFKDNVRFDEKNNKVISKLNNKEVKFYANLDY